MSPAWKDIMATAQAFRRDLHRYPELGWQEIRTADVIRRSLNELNIPWRPCANTGTVATLNPHSAGHHIALRGDMDALPITEQSGKEWHSVVDGCMHACGHDGHSATLMATAHWLKHHESSLAGPVSLIFQPAEEGGHGAREMIADGALEGVDEIFGWHNWPAIPFGKIACPDGIIMSGNGTFRLIVTGRGGHASQPELCRDPILAASAITLNLQQIIARRLPPQRAAVVSVTSIDAPSGATIIPQKAIIGGSIRVPDQATRDQINQLITEISTSTAASYGVQCEVEITPRYHATINHASQAQRLRQCWQADFGTTAIETELPVPIMASEDFSYYLREIPGAFALVGAGEKGEQAYPCHSPHYDFNDNLIPLVTQLYARLVGATLPESSAA